jgi:hypothetical protein
LQKARDEEKKKQCRLAGIDLIEIPYWWDRSEQTLAATITKHRPDLLHIFQISSESTYPQ